MSDSDSQKLLLFDIDGTLIDTGGAGLNALSLAYLAAFDLEHRKAEMPALDLAGSTDSGIIRSLHRHFGIEQDNDRTEIFYLGYLDRLQENLDGPFRPEGRVLPGLPELIHELRDNTGHLLGLLTGNIGRGAQVKVRHFGFGDVFAFGAYGDDHWDRNQLGPIAIDRARDHSGTTFSAPDGEVVIIGDTPKDIACARACGAKAVAVATGRFSVEELEQHEPDVLLEDFTDTQEVIRLLGG